MQQLTKIYILSFYLHNFLFKYFCIPVLKFKLKYLLMFVISFAKYTKIETKLCYRYIVLVYIHQVNDCYLLLIIILANITNNCICL